MRKSKLGRWREPLVRYVRMGCKAISATHNFSHQLRHDHTLMMNEKVTYPHYSARETFTCSDPTDSGGEDPQSAPMAPSFDNFADRVTRWAGSPLAFAMAIVSVLVWMITGPIFHYSDTWQLVINTGTTIVTFLMVFLIQESQNKDSVALHLKLNQLLAKQSHAGASHRLAQIDDASEEELRSLAAFYADLAARAQFRAGEKRGRSMEGQMEDE
jgi:low affinity Fe/Cu permease